jgi:hypothetical protein
MAPRTIYITTYELKSAQLPYLADILAQGKAACVHAAHQSAIPLADTPASQISLPLPLHFSLSTRR